VPPELQPPSGREPRAVRDEDLLREPVQDRSAEAFIEELEHAALGAKAASQFPAYASLMKLIAELRGYTRAEPVEEAPDPEEERRVICEVAATYGMVWPEE
jgi:hypothetical protein